MRNYAFFTFYLVGTYLLYLKTRNKFLTAYSLSVIIPLFFIHGIPLFSIPRLLLPAFPALLGYTDFVFKRKAFTLAYVVISFILLIVFTEWQLLAFFS